MSPRRTRDLGIAWAVAVAAISCERTPSGLASRQTPFALVVVSGDVQEGTVGTELSNAIVARVVDEHGAPIGGQLVNFRVTSGGGTVFGGAALSNTDGIVRERWTLGKSTADSQKVEARAVDSETGAALVFGVFRAVARAAAPDTVRAVSGDGQTAPATTALPESLLVRVTDHYGNPVQDVTVAWTMSSDAGTLSNDADVTTATGHARTKVVTGTRTGAFTVTAQVGERAAVLGLRVASGPPASITKIAGDGLTATVGTAVAVDPAVRLVDEFGNAVVGAIVEFRTVAGDGVIQPFSVATDDSGIARVRWWLGQTSGVNSLRATVGALPPVTFGATGIAGPPAQMVKTAGDNQRGMPGDLLSTSPTIRVTDQYGNGVGDLAIVFAVGSGGGSVSQNQVPTDANGVARVSWTLGPTKGINVVTAAAAALPRVTFNATAGDFSPDIFVGISLPPSGSSAGSSVGVRALVFSNFPIASVRASVGSNQIDLAHPNNYWEGSLSLAGLPRDTLQLMVTARDVNGAATDAFVKFFHNEPSSLMMDSSRYLTRPPTRR